MNMDKKTEHQHVPPPPEGPPLHDGKLVASWRDIWNAISSFFKRNKKE